MLTAQVFKKPTDYKILCSWWKHWGHPIVDADELPDTGVMIYWDEKPIFCGFLVLTNTKFAYIETFCANPETNWEDREDAILVLIETLGAWAKDLGFKRLIGIPEKTRLLEKLEVAGFQRNNLNVFLCAKEL